MAVITNPTTEIGVSLATFRGYFDSPSRLYIGWNWKKGVGGAESYFGYSSRYKYPGSYAGVKIGLDQDSLYYDQFQGAYGGVTYKGAWVSFTTIACDPQTLKPSAVFSTYAYPGVSWIGSNYVVSFEYKKGIGGIVQSTGPAYKKASPYYGYIGGLDPDSLYYFRSSILFDSGIYHYRIWGEWLTFFTGRRTIHYRAFAKGADGVTYYGEDKTFESGF